MEITVEQEVAVPMRDGATLRARVYQPAAEGSFPALVLRTPYGKDLAATTHLAIDPERAAANGYVVVIEDVRGRFASDGRGFEPYVHEFDDGFDTVQWAASLPGVDGRVGAYGVSYMGTTAWQAAAAGPPALRALATAQSTNDAFLDLSWRGGAFNWGMHLFWVLGNFGLVQLLRERRHDPALEDGVDEAIGAIDDYLGTASHLPPVEFPGAETLAPLVPFLVDAMTEDRRGPYHRARSLAGRYGAVEVPALIVAGWYDVMLSNDLRHFAAMREEAGSRAAREGTRLVIGPWSHGPGMISSAAGEIDFGIRSSGAWLDLTALFLDWFKQALAGDADRDSAPVKLFVMGSNRWSEEEDWPPPNVREQRWFLRAGGGLSREAPPGGAEPATYVYDPLDPCPTTGGALLMPEIYRRGAVDQTPIIGRGDVLVFTSDPLGAELEIIGPVHASLFASTSAVDTDWVVKLCEVLPDGRTVNLCDGILRACFRSGDWSEPEPVEPLEVLPYGVDLWATAALVKAGHRLRVIVTSSDFPRYDRNPNTGCVGVRATRTEPARQRVFLDARHPSAIRLPVRDR
ncbi:MAG: CocE/NonD family hydrolase [Actinobacteria bacterium]|nr:CocE/NonD family hydrolase [Actinomycetota bacterium]